MGWHQAWAQRGCGTNEQRAAPEAAEGRDLLCTGAERRAHCPTLPAHAAMMLPLLLTCSGHQRVQPGPLAAGASRDGGSSQRSALEQVTGEQQRCWPTLADLLWVAPVGAGLAAAAERQCCRLPASKAEAAARHWPHSWHAHSGAWLHAGTSSLVVRKVCHSGPCLGKGEEIGRQQGRRYWRLQQKTCH